MIRAVLDTCVLFRPLLCDTLLCIAEQAVEHRIEQMTTHFADALVVGHEPLVPVMATAASDRHVLAAAVRGQADAVVTENLKDFPQDAAEPYDITITHQDEFLLDLFDLDGRAVRRALARQVSRYRRQPRTTADLLTALGSPGNGCVRFATIGNVG